MCQNCYEEYGSPAIINAAVREAAELVRQVFDHSVVGGNLHIVLDDWNIEDGSLHHCHKAIQNIQAGYFGPHDDIDPAQVAIERKCCDAFLKLSLDERASALALFDGYIDAPLNS